MTISTQLMNRLRKESDVNIVILGDFVRDVLVLGGTKADWLAIQEAITEVKRLRGLGANDG